MPPVRTACRKGRQTLFTATLFLLPIFYVPSQTASFVDNWSKKLFLPDSYSPYRSVAGNEYYSRKNAKYLGTDGARTGGMRLIDPDAFNRIRNEYNGNTSDMSATASLEKESILIKEDTETIQADLQEIKDSSVRYGREYQMYLFLNLGTGLLSSEKDNFQGDNSNSYPGYKYDPLDAVNYLYNDRRPYSKLLIGQIHGHPATTESGRETISEMSSKDRDVAMKFQIAIYGVDAMYGDIGDPDYINRANPNGSDTRKVGMTKGRNNNRDKIFTIGRDALKIWGLSNPPFSIR